MAGGVAGPALAAKSWPRWFLFCLRLSLGIPALVHASCPRPESSVNMVLDEVALLQNDFPEGSEATFQCSVGYVGDKDKGTTTCIGGKWTEVTLKCRKKSCGSPGEVLNGRFDLAEGIEFGATARAICNEGYEILGQAYRQCLDAGWSGRVPTCQVVQCDEPPEIPNGEIVSNPLGEFPEYRETIEYRCYAGYTLVGKTHIVCNAFGKYEPQAPECRDVTCETPNILNSRRIGGAPPPYKLDNFVTFACNSGYEMDGAPQMTCTVNGWSHQPNCKPVMPPSPTDGPTQDPDRKDDKEDESSGMNSLKVFGGGFAGLFGFGAAAALFGYYISRKKRGDYYTREEDPKAPTPY